jgi:hypothetical protein
MILNDLRQVLTSTGVNLYLSLGKYIHFIRDEYSEENDYFTFGNDPIDMWGKYGNFEVEQIYADTYSDISIDLGCEIKKELEQ